MSGYTRDALRRQSVLEAGAVFLEKPFTPQALVNAVRAALGGTFVEGALPGGLPA
jgi:DNA-binding response OmpR family regulator